MKKRLITVCAFTFVLICNIAVHGSPPDPSKKPEHSLGASTVVPIPLGGVNAFLICGDRPILVDAGMPNDGKKILKTLEASGVKPSDLSLILITHGHSDHYGGLNALRLLTRAKIAVHQADAGFLRRGVNAPLKPNGLMGWIGRMVIGNPKLPPVRPDLVFDTQFDLKPYGVNGAAVPTPGHTDGSVSIFINRGPAIVGDLVMPRNFSGKTPVYPYYITDWKSVTQSIQKVLNRRPTLIYTGHGGPFTLEEIRKVKN